MEGLLDTPASIPDTRSTRRAELVAPDVPRALGAARILAGSSTDAADAVQDALLSAWRGLGGLRDPESFPAWFRQHVVRAAMRIAKRPRVVDLADVDAFVPDDLDRHVERRQLARAFDRLDLRDRTLLTLHHFWGLPVAETAKLLGIRPGTVKSRVHHAMTRLRAAYDAEGRR